jgi:hypothetical protein
MYENKQLPGWTFSFYYKQQPFNGEYQKDGSITWIGNTPPDEDTVKKMIHELMLFHVYE